MLKGFLAAAMLVPAGLAAAPAAAQDGVAPVKSWTGFYAGGRAGYAWQPKDGNERLDFDTNLDGNFGDTVRTPAGADAFGPGFCGGNGLGPRAAQGCGSDVDALTYYGMVGFDYQLQNMLGGGIVIGVVAEYGNANVNDSVTGFSSTPANYVITRSLRGAGAVRGRLGYAMKDTLIYGTGGVAYGKVRSRFGSTNNANSFTDNDGENARQHQTRDDQWGYTLGGGVEQRVGDHFSIGALYSFTALRDKNYSVRVGPGTAPANNPFLLVNAQGTDLRRTHRDFARHDVTVTAAYRF